MNILEAMVDRIRENLPSTQKKYHNGEIYLLYNDYAVLALLEHGLYIRRPTLIDTYYQRMILADPGFVEDLTTQIKAIINWVDIRSVVLSKKPTSTTKISAYAGYIYLNKTRLSKELSTLMTPYVFQWIFDNVFDPLSESDEL